MHPLHPWYRWWHVHFFFVIVINIFISNGWHFALCFFLLTVLYHHTHLVLNFRILILEWHVFCKMLLILSSCACFQKILRQKYVKPHKLRKLLHGFPDARTRNRVWQWAAAAVILLCGVRGHHPSQVVTTWAERAGSCSCWPWVVLNHHLDLPVHGQKQPPKTHTD